MTEQDKILDMNIEILEGLRMAIDHVNNSVLTLTEIVKLLDSRIKKLEEAK